MNNTNWTPRLSPDAGPVYQAIADALERDIERGVIGDGQRLPTHRDLAAALGLTPLTVTRAYKEAARRGLVESTVGRGTFVRASGESRRSGSDIIDLTQNVICGSDVSILEPRAVVALRSLIRDAGYSPAEGTLRHRTTAAGWMRRTGLETTPERIVLTGGAHQAMVAALAAVCGAGDVILAEELTYARFTTIGNLLHATVHAVELDDQGIIPADLERAIRTKSPKALYLVPNFQNPTGIVMSEKRRREIAAIAIRHNLILIEDDVYGFLHSSPPTPIAAYAPDHTIYISSVSKSVTPSLRLGFASVPQALVERVTAACAALTPFTSTVAAELFTQLVDSGAADRTVQAKRSTLAVNRRAAARAVNGLDVRSHAESPHLWIELPPGVDAHEVAERARARGVAVLPSATFSPDRRPRVEAVRISIGAADDARQIETAVRTLAGLVTDGRLAVGVVV
ncbi:MAG TPA: PLP-dependent aminotransferase family protein [Thermoanaerobaculia bacterium]|nr:PLP-dependent aminotransferase family protein [Thermoanaerobaculia bacterium]